MAKDERPLIDDLGRVVIPKEIRARLNIITGDPLELFYNGDGVMFKRYDPMGDSRIVVQRAIEFVNGDDMLPSDVRNEAIAKLKTALNALERKEDM